MSDSEHFILPNDQPVVELDCSTAFKGLTAREKLYAHYLSQASWNGGLIVLVQVGVTVKHCVCLTCRWPPLNGFSMFQTSPESPLVFVLLRKLFSAQPVSELKKSALGDQAVTVDEFQASNDILMNLLCYSKCEDLPYMMRIHCLMHVSPFCLFLQWYQLERIVSVETLW
jgi:hypothetical protein